MLKQTSTKYENRLENSSTSNIANESGSKWKAFIYLLLVLYTAFISLTMDSSSTLREKPVGKLLIVCRLLQDFPHMAEEG